MKGTFTLPSGRRLRVASQRRYVVVDDRSTRQPEIVYRTDDQCRAIASMGGFQIVLDTHTGEVTR